MIEDFVEDGQRLFRVALCQVDARQQRLGVLRLISVLGRGEHFQCAVAGRPRPVQLLELDERLTDAHVDESDALCIVELSAEAAGFIELIDGFLVFAHEQEDAPAQESIDGQRQRRFLLAVPVDGLLIQRQRLSVIAHAAQHRRQNTGGQDACFGEPRDSAVMVGLCQARNRQILSILAKLHQASADEQAGIVERPFGLQLMSRPDQAVGGVDVRLLVDVFRQGRQQVDTNRILRAGCIFETLGHRVACVRLEFQDAIRLSLNVVQRRQAVTIGMRRRQFAVEQRFDFGKRRLRVLIHQVLQRTNGRVGARQAGSSCRSVREAPCHERHEQQPSPRHPVLAPLCICVAHWSANATVLVPILRPVASRFSAPEHSPRGASLESPTADSHGRIRQGVACDGVRIFDLPRAYSA